MGDLGSTKDLLVDEDLIELKTSRLAERSEGEDSRDFAIYQTVRTDFDNLFDHLGKGITGGENHHDMFIKIPTSLGKSPSEVFALHRKDNEVNQNYFAIADREDWIEHGILVVNINYKGFADAVRVKVYEAGDLLASLEISNAFWEDLLSQEEVPLYPRRKFAIHIRAELSRSVGVKEVLDKLNSGSGGRRIGAENIFAYGLGLSSPKELENLVKWHKDNARERMVNEQFLVVADAETWKHGRATLVKIDRHLCNKYEAKDVNVETVAEILVWLYIGFLDWDDFVKDSNFEEGFYGPKVLFKS